MGLQHGIAEAPHLPAFRVVSESGCDRDGFSAVCSVNAMDEKPESLDALTPVRLNGTEPLTHDGEKLSLTVCDFWQWSASDLVSNLTRARFAEFIIAHALGIDVMHGVRKEWDAYDLITRDGIRIEVKTSAYVQTWRQLRLSKIAWSLRPTREWQHVTNQQSTEVRLQADVYIFALFTPQEKRDTSAPLDIDLWQFFVVPAHALQHHRPTVSRGLKAVQSLAKDGCVGYAELAEAVKAAYRKA